MNVFCPATMCPLIAPNGSPWTGTKNSPCKQNEDDCAWFQDSKCEGCRAAKSQVNEVLEEGRVLVTQKHSLRIADSKEYDCARARECQWQIQSTGLCPPRLALSKGLDPRICLF